MKKFLLLLLLLPSLAEAQTVRADRFTFNTGPCILRSGYGDPNTVVTGNICDTYWRTDTGRIYSKTSGTGTNTGWTVSGVNGSGTPETLPKWLTSTSLGDSLLTESSGNVNVAGDMLPLLTDTYDLGSFNKLWNQGYLAQLNAILFALNTQTLFGGYSTIGYNAGSLAAAVSSADTTVDFGTTMVPGHYVLIRAHDTGGTATTEFMQVLSLSAGTTYVVTRNLSGLGAKNWAQGIPFLILGTTGTGRIDLLAYDGKPRIQFVEQGAAYNTNTVRVLLGNLNNYYDYSTDMYGFVAGLFNGARIMMDQTNGFRIYGGDNDLKMQVDTAGNATYDGNLTVGTGRNKIRNSNCSVGTADWNVFTNTGLTVNLAGPWPGGASDWALGNIDNDCFLQIIGTPAPGTISSLYGGGTAGNVDGFPASAGTRYEGSAYLGVHGSGDTTVILQWLNSVLSVIGNDVGNVCTSASMGGPAISSWCRSGVVATAPSGTMYVRLVIQTTHTAVANPYIFAVQTFLGEASPTQEDLTQWGPAGITSIDNGVIETDAINTRTLQADSVTSAKILAGTIVASDIQAATITGTQIAASTITASNLSVSTLSAISGNMGTLTAGSITGGTIDGATIQAGSGDEVTLDSSGITLDEGSGTANKIKWGSGVSFIHGTSGGDLWLNGTNVFLTVDPSGQVGVSGAVFQATNGILIHNQARFLTLSGAGSNHFVCNDNDGDLYTSATTCDGSLPASALAEMVKESRAEVQGLRNELEELRADIALLKSEMRKQ